MKTKHEIEAGLRNFYGTENYHRGFLGMLMTDGVHWLCENAGCYWLTDAIMSYQGDRRVKGDEMLQGIQFWTLKVNREPAPAPMTVGAVLAAKSGPKPMAVLILERDSGDVVLTQKFAYTDFPLDEIKLYYSPADKVVLLPSEY
jgi:hypothetical protein